MSRKYKYEGGGSSGLMPHNTPKKLTQLKIDEVSSVDRGAGEGVKILLRKNAQRQTDAEVIDESVKALAKTITGVLTDKNASVDDRAAVMTRSFKQFKEHLESNGLKINKVEENAEAYPPINSPADLQRAVQAVGRAKDPDKYRQYIRARARALGMTPAWNSVFNDAYSRPPVVSQRGLKSPVINNKRNEQMQIKKRHDVSDLVAISKNNGGGPEEFHQLVNDYAKINKLDGESQDQAFSRILQHPDNVELRQQYADINAGMFPYEMRKPLAKALPRPSAGPNEPYGNPTLDGERRAVSQARRVVAEEDRLANRGGKKGRKPGQKQGKRFAKNFMKAALKSLNRGI